MTHFGIGRAPAPPVPSIENIRRLMAVGKDTKDIASMFMVFEAQIWNALARDDAQRLQWEAA